MCRPGTPHGVATELAEAEPLADIVADLSRLYNLAGTPRGGYGLMLVVANPRRLCGQL